MSRNISANVERKLYAESMGRCMNPDCKIELFELKGDIVEKAHIEAFCDTEDNSFENLIVLCPNCHKKYDKITSFGQDEIKRWKQNRKEELDKFFSKKHVTFDDLSNVVSPLLLENKTIFENYFLNGEKELWDKFEGKILVNNKKLKKILENNLNLIQSNNEKSYSNLELVHLFLNHIDEFESTRLDEEKSRSVLFPAEINSLFGVSPVKNSFFPSVESLEALITILKREGTYEGVIIGNDNPFIQLNENAKHATIYLLDSPRLRQVYYDKKCFRKTKVRLDSLNFALKYINSKHIPFRFFNDNNLREISINDVKIVFIYEYCLSKVTLEQLSPDVNSVIVNLHNWNGSYCISQEAYDFAEILEVTLLTMENFYGYIKELTHKR